MRRVRLTPKAKADLAGIWRYSRDKWGVAKARSYISWFEAALKLNGERPGLARDASYIDVGLFKYSAGSHIIFFRMTDECFDVSRILHQSMDHKRHL